MGAKHSSATTHENASSSDDNHPDNKKLSGEDWEDLSQMKRSCTDCLCLLIILGAWIAMSVLGLVVTGVIHDSRLLPGEPARLTNALDHSGAICGITDRVSTKPMGYYMSTGAVVCVSSCPKATDYTKFVCYENYQTLADTNPVNAWTYVSQGVCMYHSKTRKVINRCIYDVEKNNNTAANAIAAQFVSSTVAALIPGKYVTDTSGQQGDQYAFYRNLFGDIWELKSYIFGFGVGVAVFFSFVYTYLLRIPGLLSILIWGFIITIQILLIVGSILINTRAKTWDQDKVKTYSEIQFMYIISYIGYGVSFLYLCVMLILCKRIFLAVGIVKQAAKAIEAMPTLLFMPVVQVTATVCFLIPWTIYVVYLASSGEVKVIESGISTYRTMTYSKNVEYTFLYFLFCWFWTSEFIVALGQIIVALAVAKWYFTADKRNTGNKDVGWAFRTGLWYHAGTAAFGSLIIAIIKTIRAIVAYMQRKARQSGNRLAQCLLCCIQCCLWCFEQCLKFLNKNAYIETAIHGYSFCKAARAAFFLILRNILRISAVGFVSELVLVLGKLFVTLATTFFLYCLLAYELPDGTTVGFIGPLIITFILAYFVSSMFSEVFGMAIETVLLCYIADEEMFPPEKRFGDGDLRSAIHEQKEVTPEVKPDGDVKGQKMQQI